MFRLDKQKIFGLYQYYLLNPIQEKESFRDNEKNLWFNSYLKQEKYLRENIERKLKTGWEFLRLPPLERAILIYAIYELYFGTYSEHPKLIIDQIINFSKAYLEREKYKYINKILDLIMKEKLPN